MRKNVSENSVGQALAAPKLQHSEPVKQSFAQGRLWFLEQLHANLNWYLMIFAFRVRGPLRLDALEAAFSAIEQRHETLRTTFEERDGINLQVVHSEGPPGSSHHRRFGFGREPSPSAAKGTNDAF